MGIRGMRNLFEDNEPKPNDAEDHEEIGDTPHILLPPLKDGFHYEITKLASGRQSVVVQAGDAPGTPVVVKKNDENRTCGCGPYQGCKECGRYQGDGLNSPESRTLRHGE